MSWFASYDEEYAEILGHLTNRWEMKPRYAKAFLGAYKKSIGKMLSRGKKRSSALRNGPDPAAALMVHAFIDDHDFALIAQAYKAYMSDLRKGTHVGTDVEKAIWAILANRSDLVGDLDPNFSEYVDEHHEERFPRLFDEVFTS